MPPTAQAQTANQTVTFAVNAVNQIAEAGRVLDMLTHFYEPFLSRAAA